MTTRSASGAGRWRKARKRLEMHTLTELNRRRTFTLQGRTHPYCVDRYNSAWSNERTVEVPLALDHRRRFGTGTVLEVGNVLSHYADVRHVVVDKYEREEHVLNLDVVDYRPLQRYDLILSVSTLEHVGWDEEVIEEAKPVRAVAHLLTLLSPGGRLFVTLPLGYNPHVDAALHSDTFDLDEVFYLKRVSRTNHWRQVNKDEIVASRYGSPFPGANVVAVGLAHWQ
jgi:SAM-dependent methyltransferase